MTRLVSRLVLVAMVVAACGSAGTDDQPIDSDGPPAPTTTMTIPPDAGPVFVDLTDIILMESFPVQVVLRVGGSLPTPCHRPVWEVNDDGSTIAVRLGSVSDPAEICVQVLEPFEISIPLGSFESGSRTVTLNGDPIGDFEI
jgi:hypothetical protein